MSKQSQTKYIVECKDVCKSFGQIEVLRGLNLNIKPAEKIALIGPSGSGKTTLIRMLIALESLDSGIVKIDGELLWHEEVNGKLAKASQKHLRKVRSKLGMVFQLFNLFPHFNVLKNITIAPRFVLNLSQQEAEERAKELLKMVGLLDKMKSYPAELSGGQKQRVAIARALAMQPKVMLFDEITSALDPELIAEVLNILRKLAKETQMTMIIVTHEILFAKEIADEIAFIDEGKVLEKGPPDEILLNPLHSRTRAFLRTVIEKR